MLCILCWFCFPADFVLQRQCHDVSFNEDVVNADPRAHARFPSHEVSANEDVCWDILLSDVVLQRVSAVFSALSLREHKQRSSSVYDVFCEDSSELFHAFIVPILVSFVAFLLQQDAF